MESKEVPERLARELKGVEGKFRPGGSEEAQGNIKKVLDDSVERAMYDEFLGDMVGKGSNSYSSRKENTGNNGKGFDDCLLERVTSLEKEGSAMRRHMAEAVERATKLEKENKELRKMLTSFEAGEMQEAMMELQDDNEQLYTQIEEMEKFLKGKDMKYNAYSDTILTHVDN
jgi:regulator of replication initiation timing